MLHRGYMVQAVLDLKPQWSPTFLLLSEVSVKRVLPHFMTCLAAAVR